MSKVEEYALDQVEMSRYLRWLSKHKKECKATNVGFRFEQTGIGVAVSAHCKCGAEKNITNYDRW